MKSIKKILLLLLAVLALGMPFAIADEAQNPNTQQLVDPQTVNRDNAKVLRIAAMEAAQARPVETLEDKIRLRLFTWWGEWQPDYEGWLVCANDLYAENATIYAIGGAQRFSDYKESMKGQRSLYDMEMGPIQQITVEGNTAALVYTMYLTPKTGGNPASMLITEYNTFEEIDGKLMVTRLDLYTDGGSLATGLFTPLKWSNLIALAIGLALLLIGVLCKKRALWIIGAIVLLIAFVALAFML